LINQFTLTAFARPNSARGTSKASHKIGVEHYAKNAHRNHFGLQDAQSSRHATCYCFVNTG
jgi:hypothetical protein